MVDTHTHTHTHTHKTTKNNCHEQPQHIQKPCMQSQVPGKTYLDCPHHSPCENIEFCPLSANISKKQIEAQRYVVTFL